MIYQPGLTEVDRKVWTNVSGLSNWYPPGNYEAKQELDKIGKPAVDILLMAAEVYPSAKGRGDYLDLLKRFAGRDLLSFEQLQRYRQLITPRDKK